MKFSVFKKTIIIFIFITALTVIIPITFLPFSNVANAAITTKDGFVFQDGVITGYEGTATIVNVPATISGQAVVEINGAFNRNHTITQVIVPEGVKRITNSAFMWCSKLESITLPSTLNTIEASSLSNCESLAAINLSAENTSFKLGTDNALYNSDFTTIVQYINTSAPTIFAVPDTVTSIMDYAFGYSENLISITVPDTVVYIGEGAFMHCNRLTEIVVDAANINYMSSPSGVLFSKNGKTLLCYPSDIAGASYTIPTAVTTLAEASFTGAQNLQNLTFSAALSTINFSIYGDSSIQNVYVPETNSTFSSTDGVLMSDDGSVLHYYPSGRTDTEYIVPETVTTIDFFSFIMQPYVQSIIMHENVAQVYPVAIAECASLTSVTIYGTETELGIGAIDSGYDIGIFGYAHSTAQEFAEINQNTFYTIGRVSDWQYDVITSTTCDITGYTGADTDVYVPSIIDDKWVSNVSVTTFDNCSEIDYITFCESITSIEVSNAEATMYMFEDCISLSEIYFPSTLNTLNTNGAYDSPFKGALSLVNVVVEDGNSAFYDVEGVLFKSDKTLIYYPNGRTGKSYSIPKGTKDISPSAFKNIYLNTITVPGTVTSLLKGAEPTFKGNITNIYLSEGMEIVEDVFSETSPMYITFPQSVLYISGFDVADIHTFYVYEDSVALAYAIENNIKYLLRCLVTFESNGGTSVDSRVLNAGSLIEEPANVTKPGNVLLGWYSDPEFSKAWNFKSDTVKTGMTLYAKWTEGYAIIYHLNGGVNSSDNPIYYLVNQEVVLKYPTKAGYLFDGWYTDSSCGIDYQIESIKKGTTGVVEIWADWWIDTSSSSSGSINSSSTFSEKTPEVTFSSFPSSVLYMQNNQDIEVKGKIDIKYGNVKDISVEYSGTTDKLYKYSDGDKNISSFSYAHKFNTGEINYEYDDEYTITVTLQTMQSYIYEIPIYKSVLMTEAVGAYNGNIYFNNDKVYELRSMAVSGNYFEIVNTTFTNLTPEICEIKNGKILVPRAAGTAKIQTTLTLENGSVLEYENEFKVFGKNEKEPSTLERELQCQCYGEYCSGLPEGGIDPDLITLIEKIESEIGKKVYIISGYRCEEYNKIFGGSEDSEHLKGTAADIWVKDMSMDELYDICDMLNENGGVGKYNDHIHIDTRGEYLRWGDEE